MSDMTADDVAAVKEQAAIDRYKERADHFESVLRMNVAALARAEREVGLIREDLRQANILADRYQDLLCTIAVLAEGREDLPPEVLLVVAEARAVARC